MSIPEIESKDSWDVARRKGLLYISDVFMSKYVCSEVGVTSLDVLSTAGEEDLSQSFSASSAMA